MTFVPILSSTLGTITEGSVKELEDFKTRGGVEIIQTTNLLR